MSTQEPTATQTIVGDKPDRHQAVGLSLSAKSGSEPPLVISSISNNSIFANTELRADMALISVNGMDCDDMSVDEVVTLLQRIKGKVTLEVQPPPPPPVVEAPREVTVTVRKEYKDSKIGLRLGATKDEILYVKRISPDSLFANTELEEGMLIQAINGMEVGDGGMTPDQATELLKRVKGNLTVEAATDPHAHSRTTMTSSNRFVPPPPANPQGAMTNSNMTSSSDILEDLARSSIHDRPSSSPGSATEIITVNKVPGSKVGLSLTQTAHQGLTVSRVNPDGLLGSKGIAPNMRLMSVNGTDVQHFTVPMTVNLISGITGHMTFVFEPPSAPPASVGSVREDDYQRGPFSAAPAPLPPRMPEPEPEFTIPLPNTSVRSSSSARIEARASRPNAQTRIGLRLKCKSNGDMEIQDVAPDGLFARTALRPGMRVLAINKVSTAGRTHPEVLRHLASLVGDIVILAQ